ncbi:MAG: metallophosphoesterase [Bacteroidetes bacterium]|nr:metallophosphoesterase [Bacteroidota bacterium]
MRRLLRILLLKPILWAAAKFSSKPDKERIFKALTKLYTSLQEEPGKRGLVIPFEYKTSKFIIFSDQHKGRRNGADDFMLAEPNYLSALQHYYEQDFYFINLGDSEELWENSLRQVKKKNKANFEAEKKFLGHNRYIKVFGNHDLFWDNDPLAWWHLKNIYGEKVKVYEGVVLLTEVPPTNSRLTNSRLTIFLTHGHQGDASSDGNWFSKFFVAKIWAPLQAFLRINPNTPAYDAEKKTWHNHIMYEWSAEQQNTLLVTGHTHQPVFASLTHLERLYKKYQLAEAANDDVKKKELKAEIQKREKEFSAVSVDYLTMKPTYFNSGCCCFSDGDITGIEIAGGCIRLVKWTMREGKPVRMLLEEISVTELIGKF